MIASLLTSLVRLFTGARGRWPEELFVTPRPRVYFANHTSNLDFVVLWSVLPTTVRQRTRAAAARDYWTGGPVRRWLASSVFNVVLIERKQVTRANNPIRDLGGVLERGDSIILFPEGGRFSEPEPMPFKSGLFHLAQEHPNADLVPVWIDNLNRVLPKGELLAIPFICSVTFGTPLARLDGETKDAFADRARAAVIALRGH